MNRDVIALAEKFIGCTEGYGNKSNPQILAMLQLVNPKVKDDATPWCSSFVCYVHHLLGLPHPNSLRARSWLELEGTYSSNNPNETIYAGDVLIFKRGRGRQPGPEVIKAQGHVGFAARNVEPEEEKIPLLGGNQNSKVCIKSYPRSRLLGIRSFT